MRPSTRRPTKASMRFTLPNRRPRSSITGMLPSAHHSVTFRRSVSPASCGRAQGREPLALDTELDEVRDDVLGRFEGGDEQKVEGDEGMAIDVANRLAEKAPGADIVEHRHELETQFGDRQERELCRLACAVHRHSLTSGQAVRLEHGTKMEPH